ncbi:MAG: 3-phosphoserine/phosphohydroxythreonine transaminase [Planctomycetia bacterium]|nr:3-phosphoserine/phosphohydroxythreonine transaminase [Planctomycetia bacterium]
MDKRVYNFSPGPATLPLSVLQEAQRDLLSLPGLGVSALEISHRCPWFDKVLEETEANLRDLLKIPANFKVLFMQGGSRLQFSMVPMNLLPEGQSADYIVTGAWSKMGLDEAKKFGTVRNVYDAKATNYDRLPAAGESKVDPKAAYAYFTSNETIQGVQFLDEPETGSATPGAIPLVCDASSDFLCRPLPMDRYGLIYSCAQKNSGPAGVTTVIVREDLLARSSEKLPTMMNYALYAKEKSLLNTPPVFAIYIMLLVTRWLKNDIGGLDKMLAHNKKKAKLLYDVIDASEGFYTGHAQKNSRSLMNVTFKLPDEETQKRFIKGAEARDLHYLPGHRSVGGIRASIYNAMPIEGVEALAGFMQEFRKK